MIEHSIPTYALYGEHEQPLIPESLHCESIAARSRLYEWEIQPHRHDLFLQFLYIRRGGGEALIEAQRVPLKGPCVLFVPPLAVHGFRFTRDIDGEVITVVAHQVAARLAANPELFARFESAQCLRLTANSQQHQEIDTALMRLVDEYNGSAPWRMVAIEAALSLMLVLIGRAMAVGQNDAGEAVPRSLLHVQRFRALVDRWFRSERAIGFYTVQLGITPTQLNRVCRQVLDKSALGVIQDRLIIEAKRDLAYSILSVKEIALTLGFTDAAYFTRFFAQCTGSAPSEFRQAAHRQLARRGSGPRRRRQAVEKT